MATEVKIICDGCEEPIEPGQQHVRVTVSEVDTGDGLFSAPVVNDYHAEHVPKPMVKATGFKLNSLREE